jgi:Ca2+-binding EF-hand superfamily protein
MGDFKLPDNLIKEAHSMFNKYDRDNNNSIDKNELRNLLSDLSSEIGISMPSDEDVEQIMYDVDLNHDKKLSRDEFLTLFQIIYQMKNLNLMSD